MIEVSIHYSVVGGVCVPRSYIVDIEADMSEVRWGGRSDSTAIFQTAIQHALARFAQDEAHAFIDQVTTRVLPPRIAIVSVF